MTKTHSCTMRAEPAMYSEDIPWDQWLFLFEVAANVNGWRTDTKLMANMLMLRLRDQALAICFSLDEATCKDYAALKLKLSEALHPEDTLDVIISQLETRRRQPGETLQDLRVEIFKLVTRVYPGLEPLYLERHAKEAFLKSIAGTSYGEKAIDSQTKTLDEAVSKAMFFEQREHIRTAK